MKQYFLPSLALASFFTLSAGAVQGQQREMKERSSSSKTERVIVITPKTDVDTKLSIEIKGDEVKINGKPASEYNDNKVDVRVRSRTEPKIMLDDMDDDVAIAGTPSNRFHGGNVYTFRNSATVNGYNSNSAFLGVGARKAEGDDQEGVVIASVTPESGADKAGLKEGDIITKINDTKISSPDELTRTIGKLKVDDKVTVTYKRDKKEQKTTATLGKRKQSSFSFSSPGYNTQRDFNLTFDNLDNNLANLNGFFRPRLGIRAQETEEGKGLKVLTVDEESAAAKAGLKEGDIITSFDGAEVNNIDKLRELSEPAIKKGNFHVNVTRDGKTQDLTIKIPKNLKSASL